MICNLYRMVKITYKNQQKPILTIKEALEGSPSLIKKNENGVIKSGDVESKKVNKYIFNENLFKF